MVGIVLEHVNFNIKGKKILNDVSAHFPGGRITGIVGYNGSGKSMLFKCICGFVYPSSGMIRIEGVDYSSARRFPKSLGFIIEAPGFLPELSGLDNLDRLACIRGELPRHEIKRFISMVGLDPEDKRSVRKYSMGMKQRLGIAQAIMENPDVLILDEPMTGLDARGVDSMRALFAKLRDNGKTILISSHDSRDIESLCEQVYQMDNGHLELRLLS